MAENVTVINMSDTEKIGEALRRSLPHIPSEARSFVNALLEPQTLVIIATTLVIWAGSHAVGIGEIVDIILLGVGVFTLGFSVFEGASELCDFAVGAVRARSDEDIENAGRHFAHSVTILGVSSLQAILLRGQGRTVMARGSPRVYPPPNVGSPPAGTEFRVTRPARIPGNIMGGTSPYGEIQIARNQSLTEQRITLFHELVHRFFSPRFGPLRQLRAEMRMSLYEQSAVLRYLEEAMAEGYGQLKVHGLASALGAIKFPINSGYMTLSNIAAEGLSIGTITLGGTLFYVTISPGPIPASKPYD